MNNDAEISKLLKAASLVLGFSVMVTQIILLREFLSVFNGIELIIGMILSAWMFLTGLGAYLGSLLKFTKTNVKTICYLEIVIGIIPMLTVFLLYILRNQVLPAGQMLNIYQVILSCFTLLAPFCITSGMSFTILSVQLSWIMKKKEISGVYGFESLGSLLGGLIFSLILINYSSVYTSLSIIIMLNITMAIMILHYLRNRRGVLLFIASGILVLTLIVLIKPQDIAMKALFKNQEIITTKTSPFNHLVATRTRDQVNIYGNGTMLFSSDNPIDIEESVHYTMGQAKHVRNILILSGGYQKTIKEVLKYPGIENIDYLESDPYLTEMLDDILPPTVFDQDIVSIINKDPVLFLKNTSTKYDVIMINLPDPSTAQLNRFYTIEFLEVLKQHLNPSGIISHSLSYTGNYIGKESATLNSCLYQAMQSFFKHVQLIPGKKNYFLGSDAPTGYDITATINREGIETDYVNDYYIDTSLVKLRSEMIIDSFEDCVGGNNSFKPMGYFHHLKYWFSYDKSNLMIILLFILIPFTIIVFKLSPVNLGLFAGGFTAASVEFILIISFQIIYGYVYQIIGLIITTFMAGLVFGSLFLIRKFRRRSMNGYLVIQVIIGFLALFIPVIMYKLNAVSFQQYPVLLVFFFLIFLSGLLTGLQYAYATGLSGGNVAQIAASTYSSDLIGSGLGALLMAAIIIPLMGILNAGVLLFCLNFVVIFVILYKRKRIGFEGC
jgi:spermidine synthase